MSIRGDSLHDITKMFEDQMEKKYRRNGNGCTEKTINKNIVIGTVITFVILKYRVKKIDST